MIERGWFIPCTVLTALAALYALLNMPHPADLLPAMQILPAWMVAAALIATISGYVRLARSRAGSPTRAIAAYVAGNWRFLLGVALSMALAGLNLITFMWIKPLLNVIVPFRADPLLADLDAMLFLGHDPWRFVQWANVPGAGTLYHPGWFITIIAVLLVATSAAPSPRKSAVLLTYFVLWTVVAPLIHTALPAVGPVLYAQFGYGDRFVGLVPGPETRAVVGYIMESYTSGQRAVGNGISAMPSMHVATSAWVVIATAVMARRWLPVATVAYLGIWVLSVALGWHYFVDGLVGTAAALVTYRLALAAFMALETTAPAQAEPLAA